MTTTFYPPYHIGGDAVFVQYLAEELVKRGHEVHVMSGMDSYLLKKGQISKEGIHDSGVIVHHLKSSCGIMSPLSAYIFGSSRYYTRRFSELVHKTKPDVVHHHNISLLGHPLLRKQGAYVSIHTTHDFWLICPTYGLITNKGELCARKRCSLCTMSQRRFPKFWRYSQVFKSEVQGLDIIISPSEFFKGMLEEYIQGNARARIVHIPNFAPHPPKSISSTNFSDFFLYAGVLERSKGVLSLVNLLKEQQVDVKLLIAGNGSLRHKIEEFIKRHNLQNKIILLGWVDHDFLYRLLHDANALIVPSICLENSPLISLEALSVGTPVIASNNGGLPEIVGKVDQKLIFDNWSKLGDLLQCFSKKEFSSQMIRHIYEKNFSPEAHIGKYVGIIREHLDN